MKSFLVSNETFLISEVNSEDKIKIMKEKRLSSYAQPTTQSDLSLKKKNARRE